jgi:pimeloyl-ACP methyl ester carboxylesterase
VQFRDPAPGEALHLTGSLGPGALYTVDKPANWNGGLVIWAHGYSVPTDPIHVPNLGPLLPFFLSQGFAVAVSSFSENGYAVAEGVRQTHQLGHVFTSLVARPQRTFIVGGSLGGIIGLKLVEQYDRSYDGALLFSGVVGGSDDEVRYVGDVWMLFDQFFPGQLPPLFGPRPGPFPQAQLLAVITDPANAQSLQLFLAFARERGLTFASGTEAVQATLTSLGFGWIGALDLFDRTHGHVLYDNANTVYTAPGVPQSIVDAVNAQVDRLRATPDAKAFLKRNYEPDGDLHIPVITMHDQRDPLVPFFHEQKLHDAVAAAGRLDLLRQYNFASFGHASSTVQAQIPAKFLELVAWANSLSPTP